MVNIPYSTQTINEAEIAAVAQVLRSDWLTTGPMVEKFEAAVAGYVGVKYAVAVSSGTAALHVACMAAGIKPGDEVIVPTYTFAATANCVVYCGGKPVLADIDEKNLCIDIRQAKKKITSRTKAIIAVDFGGRAADWQSLRQLAKKYNLILIDDAAHSFGAKNVGNEADLTCFSFHPVKTITTGEGGMIVTNNKRLYQRTMVLRTHGIVKLPKSKPWYYEMRELGYNYRLTDLQSALGLAQLKRAEKFLRKRRQLAQRYHMALTNLSQIILPQPNKESAWHLYPLRVDFQALKKTRVKLFNLMQHHGISLQVHYIPIHLQPYYQKNLGYRRGDFPVAEKVYEQEVSLPLYPTLTYKQQDKVVKLIRQFVR